MPEAEYSGNPKLGSGSRWLVGDRMGRVSAEIVLENRRLFLLAHFTILMKQDC